MSTSGLYGVYTPAWHSKYVAKLSDPAFLYKCPWLFCESLSSHTRLCLIFYWAKWSFVDNHCGRFHLSHILPDHSPTIRTQEQLLFSSLFFYSPNSPVCLFCISKIVESSIPSEMAGRSLTSMESHLLKKWKQKDFNNNEHRKSNFYLSHSLLPPSLPPCLPSCLPACLPSFLPSFPPSLPLSLPPTLPSSHPPSLLPLSLPQYCLTLYSQCAWDVVWYFNCLLLCIP